MSLDSLRVRWVPASSYTNAPAARCGHVAVAITSEEWGGEFLIVHGGINKNKEALDDLVVLQCDQEAWFTPGQAAMGPAARAFHCGAAIGRLLFVFGGHIYVPQHKKLHQFNDMWCLNTDTWEWSRMEVSPDAPQPCPRDRASMVAVGPNKLLLYGGADALNRRLDDMWIFDIEAEAWREVKPTGPKPRPRCCTSLIAVENRVLMFGGDNYGVTNELWSLRGVFDNEGGEAAAAAAPASAATSGSSSSPGASKSGGPASPQWTLLQLEGPAPPPRRGHAAAALGRWVVFMGGLTEQKSMLGIKSRSEYLADVVVLDRQVDRVSWRGVEVAAAGEAAPAPREKHSLTALSGGRLLMFGGTDGQTTLGDAWWLEIEDIAGGPSPHAVTAADFQNPAFALAAAAAAAQQEGLGKDYVKQQQQQQQEGEINHGDAAAGAALAVGAVPPSGSAAEPGAAAAAAGAAIVPQPLQQQYYGAPASPLPPPSPHLQPQALPPQPQPQSQAPVSAGFSYLPASLTAAVPAGLTSAFSSFRERLGLPASSSASSLGGGSAAGGAAGAAGTAAGAAGWGRDSRAGAAGGGAAGAAGAAGMAAAALGATEDEGLLALGQRALLSALSTSDENGGGGSVAGGGWDAAQLVQAARHFLASCRPEDLRLGDLPVLMADYRRVARVGWAMVLRERGIEGLLGITSSGSGSGTGSGGSSGAVGGLGGQPGSAAAPGGLSHDLLMMPGRFLHLPAEELRMREVPEVLADYQLLLASQAPDSDAP